MTENQRRLENGLPVSDRPHYFVQGEDEPVATCLHCGQTDDGQEIPNCAASPYLGQCARYTWNHFDPFAILRNLPAAPSRAEPETKCPTNHNKWDGHPRGIWNSYSNRPLSAFKVWTPKFCPDCGANLAAVPLREESKA